MSLDIDKMRAIRKQISSQTANYDSSIFSFKDLNVGDTVHIRFIDDGEANDWFWRVRCTRTLKFNSIRLKSGEVVAQNVYVSVPTFNCKKNQPNLLNVPEDMLYYSSEDVLNLKVKPFWDGTPEGAELYNRFKRSEQYVLQGFVRSEGYSKKLYRFLINKELFKTIYSFIDDTEIEHTPTDPVNGREFLLKVTEKVASIGGSPRPMKDYAMSKWSSKETPLTDEEQSWLDNNHPFILRNFIPARPSVEQEKVMLDMFEASYNEEPYDCVKWLNVFKPDNVFFDADGNIKSKNGSKTTTNTTATSTPVAESVSSTPANPLAGMTAEQISALLAQAQTQTASIAANIIAEPKVSAPTLIKEHTEEVTGDNPDDIIAGIMSKFKS